jgi:hypothetical protein
MNRWGLLIVLLLSTHGCGQSQGPQVDNYTLVFKRLGLLLKKDKSVVLVLPNSGCTGCINQAETFMMGNIANQPKLLVVFTAFNSKKALKIRFNQQILQFGGKQVFLDTANEVAKAGLANVYPVVCFAEQGKVSQVIPLNANGRSPLDQILDYLAGRPIDSGN